MIKYRYNEIGLPPILHQTLITCFSISSVRMQSIFKMDSPVESSIQPLLVAHYKNLLTCKFLTSQVGWPSRQIPEKSGICTIRVKDSYSSFKPFCIGFSGAPTGQKGRRVEPHTHRKLKEPCFWFFVIIATTSPQHGGLAAILQKNARLVRLTRAYIVDIGYPCYGQLTSVKTSYPLTSIT